MSRWRATNKHVLSHPCYDETGYVYERGLWRCIQAPIAPVAIGKGPAGETLISG
jgi:hypothetical protein